MTEKIIDFESAKSPLEVARRENKLKEMRKRFANALKESMPQKEKQQKKRKKTSKKPGKKKR